jgi:hypothetical protein
MRVIGALLLLIGLALGFSPGAAEATPCPSHAHHAVGHVDRGAGKVAAPVIPAEVAADVVADLLRAPAPEPFAGHVAPEGQACCHAAPSLIQGAEVDPVPLPSEARVRPALRDARGDGRRAFDIFRPPATA